MSVTNAEFIERIRRSGLFPDTRLDDFLEQQSAPVDDHAEPIAVEMVRTGLLTEFQSIEILNSPHPDFFIAGKYSILELLGRGGMGSVFLCEHMRMRRLVAIKVLPEECEADPAMLARFEREAQAVAALDHPNVVHAYDIDQAGGRHFLVMEFIDGIDLQTLVSNNGPLSPELAAWCVMQAARGLHHAWLAGWVHRDIKPGNLLLERTGTVKILDMGLARIFDHSGSNVTSLFNENTILGTADYISPEQASGSLDTDIRGDIYSLGATFYFLLCGKAPFEDGSVSQKLLWHRTMNPLPIRERRPQVPEAMAAVVSRMLEKEPRNRYAAPGDIAELLQSYCTPPPKLPGEAVMPTWSPAVVERIRACQAPADLPAPQTASLGNRPAPKTDLAVTGKLLIKPAGKHDKRPRTPVRKVELPLWLMLTMAGLIAILTGWTVYREATRPKPQPATTAGMLPILTADEADTNVDGFACVDMQVGAVENSDKNVYLYSSPTHTDKCFFVLIDRSAVTNGRFDTTDPVKLEKEFSDRRIRVVGRITRQGDDTKTYRTGAPYIKVVDPKQIQILSGAE